MQYQERKLAQVKACPRVHTIRLSAVSALTYVSVQRLSGGIAVQAAGALCLTYSPPGPAHYICRSPAVLCLHRAGGHSGLAQACVAETLPVRPSPELSRA